MPRLFAAALGRRTTMPGAWGDLYSAPFAMPQITLFQLVARLLDSVSLAVAAATEVLVGVCAQLAPLTIVDVGTGNGEQVAGVLRTLPTQRDRARRVTVVAIEPSELSLRQAEANARAAAAEARLDLSYVALRQSVEALAASDWRMLAALAPGCVVNASFSLHHIGEVPGQDARDTVLTRLRALDPAAIVVTEPDVDHYEPDLATRFRNCWAHFHRTFRLIDDLDLELESKLALKTQFFGREIEDILGASEEQRCERHEPIASWESRLSRAGFGHAFRAQVSYEGVPLTGVVGAVGTGSGLLSPPRLPVVTRNVRLA